MDKTCALLSRTNLGLRPFEAALSEAQIPYHLLGSSGFWAQPEVKAILSYLGCVIWPTDWLIAGAIRAPFWPTKYLPKTKLLAALKTPANPDDATVLTYWASLTTCPEKLIEPKNLGTLRDFVTFVHSLTRYRDLQSTEALKQIITVLKAVEYYHEEETTPDNDPVGNLIELVKISSRFGNIKDFLDYTRRASAASKSKKGVALSTIHGAKGLEFHTVYLVGCQEGMLPHAKSTDLQEERHLLFVAASRAERELVITFSGRPSPFIENCDIMKPEEPNNGQT